MVTQIFSVYDFLCAWWEVQGKWERKRQWDTTTPIWHAVFVNSTVEYVPAICDRIIYIKYAKFNVDSHLLWIVNTPWKCIFLSQEYTRENCNAHRWLVQFHRENPFFVLGCFFSNKFSTNEISYQILFCVSVFIVDWQVRKLSDRACACRPWRCSTIRR